VTEVVDTNNINAVAHRGVTKAPKWSRKGKRPSRSKAAVAARRRVLEPQDEVPCELEGFCWDKEYDIGIFFNDEGVQGFAHYDMYVPQDLQDMQDSRDLDGLEDLGDLGDLEDLEGMEGVKNVEDHHVLLDDTMREWESFTMEEYMQEKHNESLPHSPRTPLEMMMMCA